MRPLNFCLIMVFLSPFLCNGDQIRPVKAKGTNFSILNCKLGEKFIPWIEKITPWNLFTLNKGIFRLCKKFPDSKGIMLPTFLCLWSPHCTALHCTAHHSTAMYCSVLMLRTENYRFNLSLTSSHANEDMEQGILPSAWAMSGHFK